MLSDYLDPDKWEYCRDDKDRPTKYAVRQGDYTITKFIVCAQPRYLMHFGNEIVYPHFDDVAKARAAVVAHAEQRQKEAA
jgi:hypothetical protein